MIPMYNFAVVPFILQLYFFAVVQFFLQLYNFFAVVQFTPQPDEILDNAKTSISTYVDLGSGKKRVPLG